LGDARDRLAVKCIDFEATDSGADQVSVVRWSGEDTPGL